MIHIREVDEHRLKCYIWDTAGQEKFRSLAPMYYRDAHGALIFYDITDRMTFYGKIDEWVNVVKGKAQDDVKIVIVGNKVDMENEREVTTEEGRECAERLGASFFEVSAKDGTCVNEAFSRLVELIVENNWESIEESNKDDKSDQGIHDLGDLKKKKTGCCLSKTHND